LSRQVNKTRDYCLEHYNTEGELISDVGSGVSFSRKGFLKLVGLLVNKEVDVLVVNFGDRLCRVGFELISHICQEVGCKLDVIETNFEEGEDIKQNELCELLVSFTTSFCNKMSGLKARKALIVELPPDLLRKCYKWYKGGISYAGIAKRLEGVKDEKGRSYSKAVIRRELLTHWKALEKMGGDTPSNSFEIFFTQCCKQIGYSRQGGGISRKRLLDHYTTFCQDNQLERISDLKVTYWLKKVSWVEEGKRFDTQGLVIFKTIGYTPQRQA